MTLQLKHRIHQYYEVFMHTYSLSSNFTVKNTVEKNLSNLIAMWAMGLIFPYNMDILKIHDIIFLKLQSPYFDFKCLTMVSGFWGPQNVYYNMTLKAVGRDIPVLFFDVGTYISIK